MQTRPGCRSVRSVLWDSWKDTYTEENDVRTTEHDNFFWYQQFMLLLFCLSFDSYIFDKLILTPKGLIVHHWLPIFGKEISGLVRTSGLGWRLTWGHYLPCSVWCLQFSKHPQNLRTYNNHKPLQSFPSLVALSLHKWLNFKIIIVRRKFQNLVVFNR